MDLDGYPALKRILEEYYEMQSNRSDDFKCGLLERDIFEWQFAVRGAIGTEFEGGIYHGRVLFPSEYPFKPPSIIALTENGRFKTHTEISLRRLDKWQPSYRVRDVFVDFVHLMPTPTYPDELCSLECNKEERRALVIKSRAAAPKYGTSERQKVIDQIHQYMLSKAPNGTGGGSVPSQASNGTGGVNTIGNIFCAINADGVGILGCMNEAGVGIVCSMYEPNGTGGGYIIGNIFCATNSDGVIILDSVYEPFIGEERLPVAWKLGRVKRWIFESIIEKFTGAVPNNSDDSKSRMLPVPPQQAFREHEHSQNDGNHGGSVVNNITIRQNTFYATNSNRVGISLTNSREVEDIRNMVLANTVFTGLGFACNVSVLFYILLVLKAKQNVCEDDRL